MLNVTVSNKKKIIISLLFLFFILLCLNPKIIIPIYKSLYTKYVRIIKSSFRNRFSKHELNIAILYAKNQGWVQDQISTDLRPFKNGISSAQIDDWFKNLQHAQNKLVKFIVKNNQLIVDVPRELITSRAYKTVYGVIELLVQNHKMPDCKFIVSLNDYLSYIPNNWEEPVAIFSFAKHTKVPVEQTTIVIPDWMNTYYWDVLRGRINVASYLYPWKHKKPLIHWRGGRADSMQHRAKLIALKNKFTFLDVGMTEGDNRVPYLYPEYSLQYKYQISLDGARATWERVVWQMYSNSVLIKPDSPQVQWFYKGLQAYNNYIPLEDLSEQKVLNLYNWLITNDLKVQEIISNANVFARNNFKTQDFFAYYVVLLEKYAKLML